MMILSKLDYYLGRVCEFLMTDKINMSAVVSLLTARINSNEKDAARCKPVSETMSSEIIQLYNFNVGSALKHIFAFTRTIKKGNKPNKTELKVALKYINKEIERLGEVSDEKTETPS